MGDGQGHEGAESKGRSRPACGEAGEMAPSDWRTPEGMGPDDIVSSGGSGDARTPPSGVTDDGRTDP